MKTDLYCEVMDKPESRSLGLQHVNSLPWNQGMLFVFETPTTSGFWMKNTPIPLDLIFLDKYHNVLQITQMDPGDFRVRKCEQPYKYAIEVNQGWCEAHNIKPGCYLHDVVNLVL